MPFNISCVGSGIVPLARTKVTSVRDSISSVCDSFHEAYRRICGGIGDRIRIAGTFSPFIAELVGESDAGVVDTVISPTERAALEQLTRLVRNTNPVSERSEILIRVFTEIRSPRTLPFMRKLLNDKSEQILVRKGAAYSLGQICTDEAFNLLRDTFTDEDCDLEVRKAAAWTIGNMEKMDAKLFLLSTSKCDNGFMCIEAMKVLRSTDTPSTADAGRAQLLGEFGEEATALLAETTTSEDELALSREILGNELYEALEPLFRT